MVGAPEQTAQSKPSRIRGEGRPAHEMRRQQRQQDSKRHGNTAVTATASLRVARTLPSLHRARHLLP